MCDRGAWGRGGCGLSRLSLLSDVLRYIKLGEVVIGPVGLRRNKYAKMQSSTGVMEREVNPGF